MKLTEKEPIIALNNIGYTYESGTEALKSIHLNIYEGELIGIMGQNGAGKTTLIRTLNGLIRPSKGSIIFKGENIAEKTIAQLSQQVGLIFQNPQHQLFSNTIEDEIKFSLKSLNLSKVEIKERIERILKVFNLEKFRERSPLNLSGGETKKLAIASIICRNPNVLVFDEPTLGQDAKEIRFFMELLKAERDAGKTIIIITHNIEFALNNIPRIVLMANGTIIADGPTKKVLSNSSLISKVSLQLPQLVLFCQALNEVGISCPENPDSNQIIIETLKTFILNKVNEV